MTLHFGDIFSCVPTIGLSDTLVDKTFTALNRSRLITNITDWQQVNQKLLGKHTAPVQPQNELSIHHMSMSRISQSRLTLVYTLWFKKNAPTLADYNYDPVQSILIIFSKLFVNDNKRCLVVKFSTSPHICCHYTLWNTMLYFALITLLIARNAPTSDHHITSISVKEF